MNNKTFLSIIFVFTAVQFIFAGGDTSKTKYEIADDDPILSMIDSITLSGYFESLGLKDNFSKSTKYKYAKDSVPEFDEATYIKRFKKMDDNLHPQYK